MIAPGMPDLLVEHGNEVFQRADGQMVVGPHLIADEETWGQLVSGYRCAWCLGVQSQAFPERCEFEGNYNGQTWRCSGRIRDEQLPYLARTMRGHADYSPPDPYQTLDDERDYWKQTKFGLVIPRDIGS